MISDCGNIWFDKPTYEEAETKYYLWLQKKLYGIEVEDTPVPINRAVLTTTAPTAAVPAAQVKQDQSSDERPKGKLSAQIAATRQQIRDTLTESDMATAHQVEELKKTVNFLVDALKKVEQRMSTLETTCKVAPVKSSKPAAADDDDDDIDLFGSGDEDEAADAERQARLKQYADKKSKKPAIIAKSSIVLDVKPWDDETDMKMVESSVRSVVREGLVWGTSKLVPVGYGINKLQIVCVVEDDKVSIDELTETITDFTDYVQSVDIAAFNKI